MEVKSKKVKIGNETFYIRKSNRAFIEFEKIAEKSVSEMTTSIEDSLTLCYACVKAGMMYEKKEFNLTLDEFIDKTDGHLVELTKALGGDTEKKRMLRIPRS